MQIAAVDIHVIRSKLVGSKGSIVVLQFLRHLADNKAESEKQDNEAIFHVSLVRS